MEQTTDANGYTYYYYQMPDGGGHYTGYIEDWMGESNGDGADGELRASSKPESSGDGSTYHNSSYVRGFVHSANIGTVITVINMVLNIVLIVLVLLRRSTRVQFVYQQIINLALSDLAFSVMVDPFTVYFELQPWRLAQGYCVTWMVLDAALPFVSFLVLIMLNVDRLLFAISPSLYHTTLRRTTLRGLFFLLPWMLGLGVVLPLWLLTAVVWPRHGICMYGITKRAAVASAVTSLYLPCVILIVLSVLILVTIIGGMPQDLNELSALRGPVSYARSTHVTVVRQQGLNMNTSTDLVRAGSQEGEAGRAGAGSLEAEGPEAKKSHRCLVVALCVLNLLTVITQLPYGAISLLEPECVEPSCHSTIKLIQALSWMRSVTFSLHPLCLMTMTHIRQTCCALGKCHTGDGSGMGLGSGSEREFIGLTVTPSGNTKSDQIELTSVNTTMVNSVSKGSTTML